MAAPALTRSFRDTGPCVDGTARSGHSGEQVARFAVDAGVIVEREDIPMEANQIPRVVDQPP